MQGQNLGDSTKQLQKPIKQQIILYFGEQDKYVQNKWLATGQEFSAIGCITLRRVYTVKIEIL